MKRLATKLLVLTILCLQGINACAREYHVAKTGSDQNPGTAARPFNTISAAARIAQPGDTITVHGGVYRERVNPPRGGSSDTRRIVYQAAPGETVHIKGSEIITGWEPVEKGVWKVTLPNRFFGDYNPYQDLIAGDWFYDNQRPHHTGEVYLNGKSLYEKASLAEVMDPKPFARAFDQEGSTWTWYCQTDDTNTTIWANFHDVNPNRQRVEIHARKTCFYPDQPGRNYITVRGFHMSQAATQWAPPTAEQVGLIGTHWSRGWIIEDNVISDSKCVGLTLGKHGDEYDNTSQNSAGGYIETIERARQHGWSKEKIGHHIVRNNTIYNCEAAGICGSLGAIFSQITGNHIYNIQRKRQFHGAETAGIKIHAAIDTLIANNTIHHADKAIWLDWMAQGARVSRNLCHDNFQTDLFFEVNHGPYIVDNNICLSHCAMWDWSKGGAFAHNLFAGTFQLHRKNDHRKTPYLKPHHTDTLGLAPMAKGDNRFYNNIFCGSGLDIYDNPALPMQVDGNVYLNTARPYSQEAHPLTCPGFDPHIERTEKDGGVYLTLTLPEGIRNLATLRVTTELLGKAQLPDQPFTDYDGTPLAIDTDFFGRPRSGPHPTAGPFEQVQPGRMTLKLR